MEAGKRKRGEHDDVEVDDGRRGKTEEAEAETTSSSEVTEDEVEEFFAILKRIQMAARHLKKSRGWDRKLTVEKWRPSFVLEDFEGDNGVKEEEEEEAAAAARTVEESVVEGHSGFDLNLKPASK